MTSLTKSELNRCYATLLVWCNTVENMQFIHKKFEDENWIKLVNSLETAIETLHQITLEKVE